MDKMSQKLLRKRQNFRQDYQDGSPIDNLNNSLRTKTCSQGERITHDYTSIGGE
jgi:hypothetical protein